MEPTSFFAKNHVLEFLLQDFVLLETAVATNRGGVAIQLVLSPSANVLNCCNRHPRRIRAGTGEWAELHRKKLQLEMGC